MKLNPTEFDDFDENGSFIDEFDEVIIARRTHPFPFGTRKLSSPAPMVLLSR